VWLYGFGKVLVSTFYHLLFRIEVHGTENLPREGGVILCGNHFTAHDPLVMGVAAPRPVSFMAKAELFTIPVIGSIARAVGAFPVKRGQPDRAALKRAIEVVQSGGCFGIFPEGTRSRTGVLAKAEPGTAYFALKTGAPVVPVGISSTYKLFSPVIVHFGKPVNLDPFRTGKLTSESLEAAGEAIMAGIGAQLAPPVRIGRAAG
jgi:1-acyl-sn-glycerol-3-phosphate acyltransferase